MPRLGLFFLCVAAGAAAICWALLVPAHLRSVDARVLERAARGTPGLVDAALRERNRAVASMQARAAETLGLGRMELLREHIRNLPERGAVVWGTRLPEEVPALPFFMREAGEKLAALGRTNANFEISTVLRTAGIEKWGYFGGVGTAAGQPLEATILMTAALMEQGAMDPELKRETVQMMAMAQGERIERFYLNILALGRRFSWGQMAYLAERTKSLEGLAALAQTARRFEEQVPVLFAAVSLAGEAEGPAEYVLRYGEGGMEDLALATAQGSGAVRLLAENPQPVWRPRFRDEVTSNAVMGFVFRPLLHMAVRWPVLALVFKYELIFAGGFLLALAVRFTPGHPGEERGYVWFPPMRWARQALFGVLAMMLVMALGEPYLAQGEQRVETMPEIRLAAAAEAPPPAGEEETSNITMLDQYTMLVLVMFLVLQAIIYAVGLLKLAEIRKQALSSELKLRLLENEENLFDAGLYVGLFGTVASLVFLALGILKPSLVGAYSSTLFGILFVAILKIGHVRPYKRRLLLESDSHRA